MTSLAKETVANFLQAESPAFPLAKVSRIVVQPTQIPGYPRLRGRAVQPLRGEVQVGGKNCMSRKSSKNDRDSRHDLSNDFVQALAADWKEHGAATIEAVRQKTPDKYCELIAKVVPKEMLISADRRAEDFSDCPDMQEIGRRLLLQTGIHEVAITDTMIAQTIEANDCFVDRLLLIAKGN